MVTPADGQQQDGDAQKKQREKQIVFKQPKVCRMLMFFCVGLRARFATHSARVVFILWRSAICSQGDGTQTEVWICCLCPILTFCFADK